MTDSYTTLNPGTGGDLIDEELVNFNAGAYFAKRGRIVIAGDSQAALAPVSNVAPTGTEYGLYTRSVGAQTVQTTDINGANSRVASDDTVALLRRLVDICETLATQDSSNRQKITIDSITAGLTLAALTTVTTVTTVSTVTNMSNLGGYPAQWNLMDQARNAYANGIRNNLIWS